MGVWHDTRVGDFGAFTGQSVVKYLTNKEQRRIWKIYLAKNDFKSARQYCMVSIRPVTWIREM